MREGGRDNERVILIRVIKGRGGRGTNDISKKKEKGRNHERGRERARKIDSQTNR